MRRKEDEGREFRKRRAIDAAADATEDKKKALAEGVLRFSTHHSSRCVGGRNALHRDFRESVRAPSSPCSRHVTDRISPSLRSSVYGTVSLKDISSSFGRT
jgi:hypothetical protein